MASIIRIKRSGTSGNPSTLGAGELAYSAQTGSQSNGGDRLYIGFGTETAGDAANHYVIGGKYFTDLLDHVHGTLTASSALIADADSKLDNLKVDNLDLNDNTISSTNTNGNIVLDPNGTGYVSIVGTNGVVIPVGTDAQRGPAVQGSIRYNTDSSSFEGYSGTVWGSLGGVKSVDGYTYISAESSPGASDDTIRAYTDGTLALQVGPDFAQFESKIDTVTIAANTASSNATSGALVVTGGVGIGGDLNVTGNIYANNFTGTGTVSLGNLSVSNNTISSTNTNGNILLEPNGTGKTVITNPYIQTAPSVYTTLNEYIYDAVGGAITAGTGITVTNSDAGDTSTIAIDSTVVTKDDTQTLTNKTISGGSNTFTNIPNSALSNSSVTIGSTTISLGNTSTSIAGVTELTVDNLNFNSNEISSTNVNGNISLNPNGTGSVDVNGSKIIGLAEPTLSTDAATKHYVDTVAQGLNVHEACHVATTDTLANLSGGTVTYDNGVDGVGATLTLSAGLIAIDDHPLNDGLRILVKNESNKATRGIYVRTSATVLTRAEDFDTALEIAGGDFTFVEFGTQYARTGWVQAVEVNTVGADDIIFQQFSGAGTFLAGDGLTLDGVTFNVVGTADRITANTNSIDIASTYVGQTSITTLGTITTGTWQGDTIGIGYGGTGLTSYATGDLIYASATNTLSKLTAGANGKVLQINSSGVPVWGDVDGGTY